MNARQARDVERWALQDAAAQHGHACLLCGKAPHAEEDGQDLVVWDLCETCNSAFHFLAVGLELLAGLPAAPAVDQVAGQLELAEEAPEEATHLEVKGVVHAVRLYGIEGSIHSMNVPACYSDTAVRRLVTHVQTYGSHSVADPTAAAVTCRRCRQAQA